jgi:hypothetical protein
MVPLSTKELEKYVRELHAKLKAAAAKDGIECSLNVAFSRNGGWAASRGEDGAFAFAHGNAYRFIIVEQGRKSERSTEDERELAYWILSPVVYAVAIAFEQKCREDGQDHRRLHFAKEEEMMGVLGDYFSDRIRMENEEILQKAPFYDQTFSKVAAKMLEEGFQEG